MTVAPTQADIRWTPDPEQVQDWPVEIPLGELGRINGRQGLHTESGRLVEFAIMAETELGGHWNEVARVDTCHAEVHLHLFAQSGVELDRRVLFPTYDPSDVDRGWDEGMTILVGGWEEHVRRWRRGR
jgi:hypothetical protein